jgi:hypothetical protein
MVLESSKNKKPHFVSEVRILRQYERSKLVTCHVLLPLGNDSTNIQDIESKEHDICHVLILNKQDATAIQSFKKENNLKYELQSHHT